MVTLPNSHASQPTAGVRGHREQRRRRLLRQINERAGWMRAAQEQGVRGDALALNLLGHRSEHHVGMGGTFDVERMADEHDFDVAMQGSGPFACVRDDGQRRVGAVDADHHPAGDLKGL